MATATEDILRTQKYCMSSFYLSFMKQLQEPLSRTHWSKGKTPYIYHAERWVLRCKTPQTPSERVFWIFFLFKMPIFIYIYTTIYGFTSTYNMHILGYLYIFSRWSKRIPALNFKYPFYRFQPIFRIKTHSFSVAKNCSHCSNHQLTKLPFHNGCCLVYLSHP